MKTLPGTLVCAILLSSLQAGAQAPSNLPDEYLKNLKNYRFQNTRGMRDLHPERIPWIPAERQDPDDWDFPTDEEIETLGKMGIDFPDFSFIEGGEIEEGQKRQRTHTVEHIIYALPGDAVSLYPYYGLEEYKEPNSDDFLSTMDYLETFSHWYDYKTGGRVTFTSKDNKVYDLLDFPQDRKYIQITDANGFYGGIYMSPGTVDVNYGKEYSVATPDDYIDAVKDINRNGGKGYIILTADLDFKDCSAIPMLGVASTPFAGIINGNGHIISNLHIDRAGEDRVGIISEAADGAAIYNLTLAGCSLTGRTQVGLAGYFHGGTLTARNVRIDDSCSIMGSAGEGEHFVGAILGRCENEDSDNRLMIRNVYVGGRIGNPYMSGHKNTALCGWLATNSSRGNSIFHNIVVNAQVADTENLANAGYLRRFTHGEYTPEYIDNPSEGSLEERHSNYSIVYTGCYGNLGNEQRGWEPFEETPDMQGWFDVIEVTPYNLGARLLANSTHRPWDKPGSDPENQDRRKAGTSAVFYFPGSLNGEWKEDEEYVIAADFSQTFYPDTHIKVDEMTLVEPLIAFRHIFRIRNARVLSEQLQNNNSDYVRKHQHKVTARVNSAFQMRLDSPLPTGWGTSGGVTNYYFKNSEGVFERVRQFGIRVLDGDTRQVLPDNRNFEFGSDIRMRRAHASESGDFSVPQGQFRYHTMLRHPGVSDDRHYIVQVLAKDNSGNLIATPDGDMVLMQFDINFVSDKSASLVTEAELYDLDHSNSNKYRHARDEYLKEKFGDTQFKIDFDDYFKLNSLPDGDLKRKMISYSVPKFDVPDQWYRDEDKLNLNVWDHNSENHLTSPSGMHHSFYKWPVAWESSTYGFGYNYRYNYNMYMLSTHSTNVPYHAAADRSTPNIDNEEGLYDRLYYKTKRLREANPDLNIRQQQGYFYYVNAASDPGVSARLNIELPCAGNRVIVSAWVAEMTKARADDGYEAANLSFNFVAVMKDTQERVVLHNFITGYIPDDKLGQWCNVYYSFIPRMSEFYNDSKTFDNVHHFELELAHNGESSVGADYAIDDIRAYVVPASALAEQEGFACSDSPVALKLSASFETLIEKLGKAEGFGDVDEKMNLYYAIVDKEKFDKSRSLDDAFVGRVDFSNNFTKNPALTDEDGNVRQDIVKGKAYRLQDSSSGRMIAFGIDVPQGLLRIGKEYYAVFRAFDPADGISDENLLPEGFEADTFFDLGQACSHYCIFSLDSSLKIKIDGVLQNDSDAISVCENQSPVIQLNVWSVDSQPVEIMKNAWFDWFDGSINEFESYRFKDYSTSFEIADDEEYEGDINSLKKALEVFRFRYPEAETPVGIQAEVSPGADGETLCKWMLDLIEVASTPDATGRQRLMLHQASFVLPPVQLPEEISSADARVVAIPIVDLYPNGNFTLCASPVEIGVRIMGHSPVLRHGLRGITYPKNLFDVPLRLGLSQLGYDKESSLTFSKRPLDIPLRIVASTDGEERSLVLVSEKAMVKDLEATRTGCLLLAQTNDPAYRNLGTIDDSGNETGCLLWVGEISKLQAKAGGNSPERNYFHAEFDDDFIFREGYYYRMRFAFQEINNADDNYYDEDAVRCNGQDIFTIKIVPEYMKWTAGSNLSWDNDSNWRRISSEEILRAGADGDDAHFTDGADANKRGYAPLGFTKVIIDSPQYNRGNNDEGQDEDNQLSSVMGETPWLYAPGASVKIDDEYEVGKKQMWTSMPSRISGDISIPDNVGNPSPLIEFDMTAKASIEDSSGTFLHCAPWVANSCAEVHFLPGATIMGQQHLSYSRAWVDIELDHSRWYLLSTPLKDVYAGDFYLPSDNARQLTELFSEIRFVRGPYDRFAPAVYQRGWDKGEAKVYELGKDGARNAAVKTFWSHVYNDVAEKYGQGNAFSIRADVARVDEHGDKVLFRLPKADEEYFYYSAAGDFGHSTKVDRKEAYRLNDTNGWLNCTTANPGKYFLLGNPFMTYFDLAAFLEKNNETLEQKFWIITESGQIAGTRLPDGSFVTTAAGDNPTDAYMAAPMQGFFVEAKVDNASSIATEYDESMMRRYDANGDVLMSSTRSTAERPMLRVSSVNNGAKSSSALLLIGDDDESASAAAFDLSSLGVGSTVYLARGGKARSIDLCEDADGTEIGLIADDDILTTILFDGGENLSGLMLLDCEDGSLTPVEEVKELNVKGSVSGRFFLTSSSERKDFSRSAIRWNVEGRSLTVTDLSEAGCLRVIVCDTLGRVLSDASSAGSSMVITLDKGISVIRISNGREEKVVKICI